MKFAFLKKIWSIQIARILIIASLIVGGLFLFAWVSLGEEESNDFGEDTQKISDGTKFPISDYLYKADKEQEAQSSQKTNMTLDDIIKLADSQKSEWDKLYDRNLKDSYAKVLNENKDKGAYIDENNDIRDRNGNLIKTRGELEDRARRLTEKYKELQKLHPDLKIDNKGNLVDKNGNIVYTREQIEAMVDNENNQNSSSPKKPKFWYDENGNLRDENGNIIKPADYHKYAKEIEELKRQLQEQLAQLKNKRSIPQKNKKSRSNRNSSAYAWNRLSETEKSFVKSRGGEITINGMSHEEYKAQQKGEIEYGVDEIENYTKRDMGTNEHKLLRTITADKMFPAVLITPISSQLAGKVVAQIETNIYGTTGRAVLIPKGSKAIGYYRNDNKIGDYRLQIAWTRIITPQGIHIVLSDARGADVKGYSGVIGEVISRNWEKYGMPLMFSTLGNGLIMGISGYLSNKASASNNPYQAYALSQMADNMQNDVGAVIKQYLLDNAKTTPIIIIREGSRVFISPNTDIFIPIPKGREVLAKFFKEKKPKEKEEENSGGAFGDEW